MPFPDGAPARVVEVPAGRVPLLRDQLIAVCAQAFGGPPWNESPAGAVRGADLAVDAAVKKPGFRFVAALDGDGMLVGFARGHFDDYCARLSPAAADIRLAWELADIAVAPSHQGRGLGHVLHDAVLHSTPAPRLLVTLPIPSLRDRYARWGWRPLSETIHDGGSRMVLMRHG